MPSFHHSCCVCLLLMAAGACALPVNGQTKLPADLLPEGADMAYMVRDLADFNTKLTRTVSAVWMPITEQQIWDLYFYSVGELDTELAVDRNGIGGVLLAKVEGRGEMFITYPVEDVTAVAEHFGVTVEQLREGQAFRIGNKKIVMLDDHLYVFTPFLNLFPEENRDVSEIELPLADLRPITHLLSNDPGMVLNVSSGIDFCGELCDIMSTANQF